MAAVWPLTVVTMTGKTAAGIVTVVMAARRQRRSDLWAVRCTFLIVLRHAPLAQRPSDQVNQHMAGIWTEMETGLTLALVGLCGVVVQGGLTKRVVARLGERRTLLLGLVVC